MSYSSRIAKKPSITPFRGWGVSGVRIASGLFPGSCAACIASPLQVPGQQDRACAVPIVARGPSHFVTLFFVMTSLKKKRPLRTI